MSQEGAAPVTEAPPAAAASTNADVQPAPRKIPSYLLKYGDTKERVVKEVPPPAAVPLARNEVFNADGKPNAENLKNHFIHEGRLSLEDVVTLIETATTVFANEPTLLVVDAPVTVCGDIHGQFYDLVKLFDVGGPPGQNSYLFLGDYVDRGNFSVECVLLLFAYKILYPNSFFMLRGNHECRHLTEYFTFKEECKHKYNSDVYDLLMDSFDALPLGAVLNDQFLCIHGGISPSIKTLDDIRNIDRFKEPPQYGAMCDLLWADPMEDFNDDSAELFRFNDNRGCSFLFSFRAACEFLDRNGLLCILRAHEAQDPGYKMHRKNPETGFPTVITLFSAPNYLDAYNNKGAILRYKDNVMDIRQFNHSPHPYWLPNFMDVFTWSIPFVAEKVAEMLLVILRLCDDQQGQEEEEPVGAEERARRKEALRAKVLAMTRMMKMFSTLREERETIMQLKALSDANNIPKGLLLGGRSAIQQALGDFQRAKEADQLNEKRPATPAPPPLLQRKSQSLINVLANLSPTSSRPEESPATPAPLEKRESMKGLISIVEPTSPIPAN